MGRHAVDLLGKRFGKLIVIERMPNVPKHHARWLCCCDCGNTTVAESHCLQNGSVQSCGCMLSEMHKTHGKTGSRLYNVWNTMKQRCFNDNCKEYKDYGARGISMCDEWHHDFSAFEKWAVDNGYDPDAPRGECTIDRINNDGNYEPSNCRIVSMKVQGNNRRKRYKT